MSVPTTRVEGKSRRPGVIIAVLDGVVTAMAIVSGLLFFTLTLLLTYAIFSRYFLSNALGWSVEVSEYMLLWGVFLGSPWVLRHDGHVRIDLLMMALKPGGRRWMENLDNLIGSLISLVLFVYSFLTSYEAFTRGTPVVKLITLPKWVILSVIPFGFLMLTYQFLRRTVSMWNHPAQPADQGNSG